MRTLNSSTLKRRTLFYHSLKLFTLIGIVFIFSSCTKEVVVVEEVERPLKWDRLELFDAPIYSYFEYSDYLLLQRKRDYLSIFRDFTDSACHGDLSGNDNYREPMSEAWLVNQKGYYLCAHPARYKPCEYQSGYDLRADLRQVVDPLMEHPTAWEPTESFSRLVLSGDHLLLPYYRKDEDYTLRFAILTLAEGTGEENTEIVKVTEVDIDGLRITNYSFRHWAVEGGFLFSARGGGDSNGLYRVDFYGNVQKVSPAAMTTVYYHDGMLYGILDHVMFRSQDHGKSWTEVYTFPDAAISFTKIMSVDGELFVTHLDECFRVEISEERFSTIKLDTEELDYRKIIHVTKFEGKAVIMTSGGIYTRDWDEFLADEI